MIHKRLVIASAIGVLLFVVGVFAFLVSMRADRPEDLEPQLVDATAIDLEKLRPRNFKINQVNPSHVEVTWETEQLSQSYVLLGSRPDQLTTKYYDNQGGFHREHVVTMFDLQPGRKYYFIVVSNGLQFGKYNQPLEFITELYTKK